MNEGSAASHRAYWLCQFTGWGVFTLYVLSTTLVYSGFHLRAVISIVAFDGGFCPLATHALRFWMRRQGWPTLPLARLLPRLAVACLSLAALLTSLVMLLIVFSAPEARLRDMNAGVVVGTLFVFVMAIGGWLAIYFGVLARRRQRALEINALQLEVVAHDARLRSLESQLNPHFLFNCLNSVRALIVEDPARAQTMVTRLAELLRYSLNMDRAETVTLDEELQAVNDYLSLERVRFEERLSIDVAIEPSARAAHVPRMLVLTLVENAMKHGIAHLPSGGALRISATIAGGELHLEVANSGSLPHDAVGTGVGLGNARERLRLLYGASASLTLTARDRRTVVAALSLPAKAPTASRVSDLPPAAAEATA